MLNTGTEAILETTKVAFGGRLQPLEKTPISWEPRLHGNTEMLPLGNVTARKLAAPGSQPPYARKHKGLSPRLFPLLAVQTHGLCSCQRCPPPRLPCLPGPGTAWVNGRRLDGKGPFYCNSRYGEEKALESFIWLTVSLMPSALGQREIL